MILIAVIGLAIDQGTKYLVEANMALYDMIAPIPAIEPIFRLFHVPNTGAAFGLFQGGSLPLTILASVVGVGILVYNFVLEPNNRLFRISLGLILAGTLGNLIDRLRIGHVTDFLDFGWWPVFNMADVFIVSGAVIMGVLAFQEAREEQRQAQAAKAAAERTDQSTELVSDEESAV